jgi:hypothetical protein
MESLVEYVKNIDFDLVDDPEILNNVYGEIRGNEGRLILSTETTYQMERLIKKSTVPQILQLYGRLDIAHLISRKLGSRVLELILDVLFDRIYIRKERIDLPPLLTPIEEHFKRRILDENATHVMRKLFQLVSGRRIEKSGVSKHAALDPGYIQKYRERMVEAVPSLCREEHFITFLHYLKCYRSQGLMRKVVERHFSCEGVCEPVKSYFFEHLAGMCGKRALRFMFECVKDRVMELCEDRHGNYFMAEFIRRYSCEADYFYKAVHLPSLPEHSNVVLKLVLALQENRSYSSVDSIVREYYLRDGEGLLHCTFGGEEGNFRQKYAPMLANLMRAPTEHSHGVGNALKARFKSSWLRSKGGIELVAGYYKGTDSDAEKRSFTRKLHRAVPLLAGKKEGRALLPHLMRYSSLREREYVRKELEQRRMDVQLGGR